MRTLDCIGAFEYIEEDKAGYGFVYQLPVSAESELKTLVLTLRQRLAKAHEIPSQQPRPLRDYRFRLASMLAQFLDDFHSAG